MLSQTSFQQVHHAIPGLGKGSDLIGTLSPYVRHCGVPERGPWVIEERLLLDYLIVFIERGTGKFDINGKTWEAQPGDLFWVPPDTLHRMEGYPPSMVCPYIHFDLIYRPGISHWDFSIPGGMTDPGELRHLMHPPVPENLAPLNGRIQLESPGKIGKRIHTICDLALKATPFSQLRMSAIMLDILGLILEELDTDGTPATGTAHIVQLEKAAQFMRQHCHHPIQIGEIASKYGMSSCYFRRLFAQNFGQSPHQYLTSCRLRKAKDLILHTQAPLSEIAEQTGYSSLQSFSRAFKTLEGMSPTAFRSFGIYAPVRNESRPSSYSR